MTLQLGPIVGHVGPTTAKIWIRSKKAGKFRCLVFDENGQSAGEAPITTADTFGRTGVGEVRGLSPESAYTYDVRNEAGESEVDPGRGTLSFHTAPRSTRAADFSFVFASCNKPLVHTMDKRWRVWKRLRQTLAKPEYADLRLLMLCGDQIYADGSYDRLRKKGHDDRDKVLAAYRREYQHQWAGPEVQRVLGNLPTYMVWDDHEITNGWGSHKVDATAKNRQNLFKGARQVYHEFQHSRNPGAQSGHLYYAFRHGRTGFVVLDLRGHRDCGRKTDPLMGERQWKDLRQWISDHESGLSSLFVVSSVPVAHAPSFVSKLVPKSDLRDQWNHPTNKREQKRLVKLLFDVSNRSDIPVVILGGDVHVGTFACLRSSRPEHARQPRIYQLTSSPISNSPSGLIAKLMLALDKTQKIGSGITARVLSLRTRRNFGIVRVEYPKSGKCAIRFELHEENRSEPTRLSLGTF